MEEQELEKADNVRWLQGKWDPDLCWANWEEPICAEWIETEEKEEGNGKERAGENPGGA